MAAAFAAMRWAAFRVFREVGGGAAARRGYFMPAGR